MHSQIKVTKIETSNVSKVDFDDIPFGKVYTDHMFVVDYVDGRWQNPEIKPLKLIPTHPGNLAWHYGQAIFEGMKATKGKSGVPLLFRPEKHIERLNKSARRMCMPELPEDLFLDAIRTFVKLEKDWIPATKGSALYIRPMMYATDATIGVKASDTYKFVILGLPVGPYYPKPVKLKAAENYVRAVKGGVGEAKTAGNYAASLYPAQLAKAEGYDQVMWLDSAEFKYIHEVGTMNIFFVIKDEVITPALNGCILNGITRDTVIKLLRSKGLKVVERELSIEEVSKAYKRGDLKEVFGTGTAAVVAFVEKIKWKDNIMNLDPDSYKICTNVKAHIEGLRDQTIEDTNGWVEVVL
jgi:branched-chain amino acid aminotransferase